MRRVRSIEHTRCARRVDASWVLSCAVSSMGVVGRICCCAARVSVSVCGGGVARVSVSCVVARVAMTWRTEAVMMMGLFQFWGRSVDGDDAAVYQFLRSSCKYTVSIRFLSQLVYADSTADDRVGAWQVHQNIFVDNVNCDGFLSRICSIALKFESCDPSTVGVLVRVCTSHFVSLFKRVEFLTSFITASSTS